jgi:hypothetical protein
MAEYVQGPPQLTPGEFNRRRMPLSSMAPQTNALVPLLSGERNGKVVSKAGEFIMSLSTHSNCFPIFTSDFAKRSGELSSAGKSLLGTNAPDTLAFPHPTTGKWSIDVNVTQSPPTLRNEIIDSVDEALVFLIAIKCPHALIVIRTPDGKNYSCGFGYSGDVNADEAPRLRRAHAAATNLQSTANSILPTAISGRLPKDIAHTIEPLRGAIYTADYMTPKQMHEAKIIWVGILSRDIIDNINATLATAVELDIGGNYADISTEYRCDNCGIRTVAPIKNVACMDTQCNGTMRHVGKENIISILEMKLSVRSIYLESAAFIKHGTFYNCFEWAKSILSIQYLNCGLMGNPFKCLHVTDDEIGIIINAYARLDNRQLQTIIKRVQDRLYAPGYIKRIANCFGCRSKSDPKSAGGRRRKINKKYTKRRRLQLHSSRRRRSIGKK